MRRSLAVFFVLAMVRFAYASQDTIGENGIDSLGLLSFDNSPLTGDDVPLGAVDLSRPGRDGTDTMAAFFNTSVKPTAVFFRNTNTNFDPHADTSSEISNHAEEVAGVIISNATSNPLQPSTPTGVAPGAQLFAGGFNPQGGIDIEPSLTMQFIASQAGPTVRALNLSAHRSLQDGEATDGNSQATLFFDWLASRDDTLMVTAANEVGGESTNKPIPSDNFNGITVGSSSKHNGTGKFNQVSQFDDFSQEPIDRVSTDIIAPGSTDDSVDPTIGGIDLTGLNNAPTKSTGTSFAAPMVTGTVGLLQQYGNDRALFSTVNWSNDYKHHQVMKAVLMNSADKVNDEAYLPAGMLPVPPGGFLGQERTVFMQDGTSTWFNSPAADKSPATGGLIPIDKQMGAGELNAKRALQQLSAGEFHSFEAGGPAFVPTLGWDYGLSATVGANNSYSFNQQLVAGSFFSATLTFDRVVQFATGGSGNTYHAGDMFQTSTNTQFPGIDMFSNLDLYLLNGIGQIVAESIDPLSTIDHIFFQIPQTDTYTLQVKEDNANAGPVAYAVAWWALGTGPPLAGAAGDINQDGHVDVKDVRDILKALADEDGFAASEGITMDQLALLGDVNGDGQFNNADIQALIDFLLAGNGSTSTVPEPSSFILLAVGGLLMGRARSVKNRRAD